MFNLFKNSILFSIIKELFFRYCYFFLSLTISFLVCYYWFKEEFFFFILKPIIFVNLEPIDWNFFFSKPINFFLMQLRVCIIICYYSCLPFFFFQFFFFSLAAYKKHEFYIRLKALIFSFFLILSHFFLNFYFFIPLFWSVFLFFNPKTHIQFNYFPIIEHYFHLIAILYSSTGIFFLISLVFFYLIKTNWISINFIIKKKSITLFLATIFGTFISGPEFFQQIYSIIIIIIIFELLLIYFIYIYFNLLF